MPSHKKPHDGLTFTVDGVEFTVTDKHQTAASILTLAGLDQAMYDLAKLKGQGDPFKDEQQVIVDDGEAYVTVRVSAPVA